MSNRRFVDAAIEELKKNPEQYAAVMERGNCVVLAGPGSGKTKTLTTAMARALLDDVEVPRGMACITYNNECALELEDRLEKLGVHSDDRTFIGTVHSFAISQVISPYVRCVLPELKPGFKVATLSERRAAIEAAHKKTIGGSESPHDRWRFAEQKRRRDVDRSRAEWKEQNPELARFIEAYEAELRTRNLIDFDDMPLLACRAIRENAWIKDAIQAKFPILFIDEYQDLGYALHELALMLCFGGGVRLFAVGDPDQSIYAFTGAEPKLLLGLTERAGVRAIRLRFNYRCGTKIIEASKAALGEERQYEAPEGSPEGEIQFLGIDGGLPQQADYVVDTLIPALTQKGIPAERIAVLYRNAEHGNHVAVAAQAKGIAFVRADNQALVKRNSRLCRFIEACAKWVVGGWKEANPQFRRLAADATQLIFGVGASAEERAQVELELVGFLTASIDKQHTTNSWLKDYREELVIPWRKRARASEDDWDVIDEMIKRTDPTAVNGDLPLAYFGGRIEGTGRLNLSTLHSSKGREFDAVILFGMNSGLIPTNRDMNNPASLREVRRLFYVGVTRARRELYLVFQKNFHSPLVKELYDRVNKS